MTDHARLKRLAKGAPTGTMLVKCQDVLLTLEEIDSLRKRRAETLLAAERAREERNREHVRLNAEWMAKCEELRKDAERHAVMYRLMRHAALSNEAGNILWTATLGFEPPKTEDEYDAYVDRCIAIDAALAKKEGA